MSTTPAAVIGDLPISSNTAGAPASRLASRSATSDRERASRLRSAPVANSRGLGRNYFLDGGCSMPATSAVEPVLPVEGAAPASTVEHVRPSTGRANERIALPDVPVESASGNAAGSPKLAVSASTGATGLAAITDDAEAATAGKGKGSACAKPGQPPSPANLSMAQAVAAIVGWDGAR
jgi:hypothetical protein